MKKLLTILGLAASCVGASAIQYSDTDLINLPLVAGSPITGTFDIAGGDGGSGDVSGYNPLTQTIISALAGFTFLDLNQTLNTVNVALDGNSFISGGSVAQVLTSFNGSVLGSAYLTLDSTGVISYKVELASGDPVTLVMASLTATPGDRVISVPDAGMTIGLLGFGLLASGWMTRRVRARAGTHS